MKVFINRNYVVERALGRAFQKLGHEVLYREKRWGGSLAEFFARENVRLAIFPSNSRCPPGIGRKVSRTNTLCVYWERRFPKYFEDSMKKWFHSGFSVYRNGAEKTLPCAAEDHGMLKKRDKYLVSLVARPNVRNRKGGIRNKLFAKIKKDVGSRLKVFGKIPFREYDRRFKYMADSFCSIGIWNTFDGVPLRYFEIISCRTLLITYPYPLFRKYFTPGKHYIETDNISEAVDYYLAHKKEARQIAEAGYKKLLRKHTYTQRAKEMLKLVR